MEKNRDILDILEQIQRPGFLVKNEQIIWVNQAASAMLITTGDSFEPMLLSGRAEFPTLDSGHLCVTLTIAGMAHPAVITPWDNAQLVLIDQTLDADIFRSMSLVSMEFRNPLMQAINAAHQLKSGDPASSKMNQSLMQILRLVNNMADISRYNASSHMELRDVDAFLLELFEKAGALTEGRAVLSFEGLHQPVFSFIDGEQLERAVWNILSNCIKFLPQHGIIRGKLTQHGRMLHLTIEDNGCGISESIRSSLFTRYLRQPGIEDNRYGLGLGLAIVRTAAANHGGTVLIGQSKDGGTRIVLTISIRNNNSPLLRSPLLRPDYAGGFDHALVELSDCLNPEHYREL